MMIAPMQSMFLLYQKDDEISIVKCKQNILQDDIKQQFEVYIKAY